MADVAPVTDTYPTKRIRLTIEWPGSTSEEDWARVLSETIEECDYSRITKVVSAELLTHYGETDPVPCPPAAVPPVRRGWWWRWRRRKVRE